MTLHANAKQKFVGRSVPRLEDRPLLPARAASPPISHSPANGTCAWCARPVAHGKIKSIDARAALALPGVHAVWTHADVAAHPADRRFG